MELTKLRVDQAKEKEGVWVPFGKDAKLRIAKLSSPRYKAALAKYVKEFVSIGFESEENEAQVDKATVHAMAEAILVGWTGLTSDGDEVEYNTSNAVALLTDYPEIREFVSSITIRPSNYRPDEIAKKSQTSSSGI